MNVLLWEPGDFSLSATGRLRAMHDLIVLLQTDVYLRLLRIVRLVNLLPPSSTKQKLQAVLCNQRSISLCIVLNQKHLYKENNRIT